MTELEINKFIHVEILNRCWHEFQNDCICQKPDCYADNSFQNENPNYCSDSSPRQLLNEVVAKAIERFGVIAYHRALFKAVPTKDKFGTLVERTSELLTATAKDIATACVAAWKEKNND